MLLRVLVAAAIFAICGCADGAGPLSISVERLATEQDQLLGKTIVTDGCLADTAHGAFVHRCGATGPHPVTFVTDPANLIPETFMQVLGHLRGEVKATITGKLVQIDSDRSESGQQVYLEIQTISRARGDEP